MTGNDIKQLLGARLRSFRVLRGYSQLTLAVKAGLTQAFINDIEHGKKWVSPDTLACLAEALDVQVHQFLLIQEDTEDGVGLLMASYMSDLTQSILQTVEATNSRYKKQ
jgi:transcriptional regulator with XRE-family HTH domain